MEGIEAEDALDMTAEECQVLMESGATFLRWEDFPLKNQQRDPKRESFHVQLDPLHHHLQFVSADRKSGRRVIDFEMMLNLRVSPYKDEEDVEISEEDQARFFCIAHWEKGICDNVNVHLMSFIADSDRVALMWRKGLRSLITKHGSPSPLYNSPLNTHRRLFARLSAFTNEDGVVSTKLASRVISNQSQSTLRTSFAKIGYPKEIVLQDFSFDKMQLLMWTAFPRPDVETAFKENAANEDYMTADEFLDFLLTEQRDPRLNEILSPAPTMEEIKQLIKKFEPDSKLSSNSRLSCFAFYQYLISDDNDFMLSAHRQVYQDMTLPLSHYFINTSHNTYLTGGQLQSKSTVEMYRSCLLAGCRCVELDLWDGQDGEPEITHGHTLCTRIDAKKVLEVISQNAFVTSPYPVILSFENHCSPPQMRRIAHYCKTIFGSYLLSEFLPGDGYDTLPNTLPSPEKLKYKIIIKNKKRQEQQKEVAVELAVEESAKPDIIRTAEQLNIEQMVADDEEEVKRRRERSGEIVKELSDLVNYCTPYRFKDFEIAKENNNCYHISSFPEKKATKWAAIAGKAFAEMNKCQLTRVYPNGSRVSSTNPNPQLFWNVGIQLMALNFQHNGIGTQLNHGKFMQNGRCGYVLKPPPMSDKDHEFDPFTKQTIGHTVPLTISVSVLAGLGLGRKDCAPVVEVQLYGLAEDTNIRYKTKPSRGQGVTPRWKNEQVVFERVLLPEIGLLRFNVYDHRDQGRDIGSAVIPLESLKPGYRHIPLQQAKSPLAMILVRIGVKIFVPQEHGDFVERLTAPTKFSNVIDEHFAAMEDLVVPEEAQMDEKDVKIADISTGDDDVIEEFEEQTGDSPGKKKLEVIDAEPKDRRESKMNTMASDKSNTLTDYEGSLEARFKSQLTKRVDLGHFFMEKMFITKDCGVCHKAIHMKKMPQCIHCKQAYHDACVELMNEACPKYEAFHPSTESKRAAAIRAKLMKDSGAETAIYEKKAKALCIAFEVDVKNIIRPSKEELKKMRKKNNTEADVEKFLKSVHIRLLDRELELKQSLAEARRKYSTALHQSIMQNEEHISHIRAAELETHHEIELDRLQQVMKFELRASQQELRRREKKVKSKARRKTEDRENITRQLKYAAENVQRNLRQKHQAEKVSLQRFMANETEEEEAKQAGEIAKIGEQLHKDEQFLKSAKASSPTWYKSTPAAYIVDLRSNGRIPIH